MRDMREQLRELGCVFDWDRELATCDPEYYRYPQSNFRFILELLFKLSLFKGGLNICF